MIIYNFIKGKDKTEKNVEIKCQQKWRMKKLSTKHVDINRRRSLTCGPNALAGGNFFGSIFLLLSIMIIIMIVVEQ